MILHREDIRCVRNLHAIQGDVILLCHTPDLRLAAGQQDVDVQLLYRLGTSFQNFQGCIVPAKSVHNNFHRDTSPPQCGYFGFLIFYVFLRNSSNVCKERSEKAA